MPRPKPVIDLHPTLRYRNEIEYFRERYKRRGQRFRYWDELSFEEMVEVTASGGLASQNELHNQFVRTEGQRLAYKAERFNAKRAIRKFVQRVDQPPSLTVTERLARLKRQKQAQQQEIARLNTNRVKRIANRLKNSKSIRPLDQEEFEVLAMLIARSRRPWTIRFVEPEPVFSWPPLRLTAMG